MTSDGIDYLGPGSFCVRKIVSHPLYKQQLRSGYGVSRVFAMLHRNKRIGSAVNYQCGNSYRR